MKCTCQNCDWSGETSDLDPVGIEVFQRIEPGDTFPNGECPECEALVSIAEPLRDAAPELLAALTELSRAATMTDLAFNQANVWAKELIGRLTGGDK